MIEPLDIAIEVHKICEETLIPNKVSPEHDITRHSDTTTFYANAINDAGLQVTGKQVTEAIIRAAGWDMKSPWPGHPMPEKVIEEIKLELLDATGYY